MHANPRDRSKRLPCTRAITTSLITKTNLLPPLPVREIGGIDAKAISLEPSLSIMTARVFLFVCHANTRMFHIFAHKTNKYCVYRKCRKAIATLPSPSLPYCYFPPCLLCSCNPRIEAANALQIDARGRGKTKVYTLRQTDRHTHKHTRTYTCVCVYIFDIITRKYAANVNIFGKLS